VVGAADVPSDDAASEAAAFSTMFTEKGLWARPPARWGLDASKAAEEAEMLAALRGCVELLPRSMGEAVWLRDLMALPADEVCKAMGITPTNLWSRMHRARAALRACVERTVAGTRKGAK
jgi:RNA polymerase sigma-70 factor (ECF subfamily)